MKLVVIITALLAAPMVARAAPALPRLLATGDAASRTVVSSSYSETLALMARQSFVLLDTFKRASDADDTASLSRAVAAGVAIQLRPRTYTINNFSTGAVSTFFLKGTPGGSIVRRTSASGSSFFKVSAARVFIDGVTFDANRTGVTANQWGVLMNSGGQQVVVQNSVFENNSGTLGSCFALLSTGPSAGGFFVFKDNEVTNCTFNAAFFGSVSSGLIEGNYIRGNSGLALYVGSYSKTSSTNYAADILVTKNRFLSNSATVIGIGGYSPPYAFGTPSAMRINITDNVIQASGGGNAYQVSLQGDYLNFIGNQISQSSSVAVMGGIDCNSRYEVVEHNTISLSGASYGIDCGGSVGALIARNTITMNSGALIDAGGNTNTVVEGNALIASGTAEAVVVYATEGNGSGALFPTITSGLVIKHNSISMDGSGTRGVQLFDNAGGFSGAIATQVKQNDFVSRNGASSAFAINYRGGANSISISGNTWNGHDYGYIDPNINGDIIFDDVFDEVRGYSSRSAVRSIESRYVSTYGAGGSILYVYPTSGGGRYSSATRLSASGAGCSGWAGRPLINSGVIVGVKTTAVGSGCTGTPTVTATDSGGGSGATLAVGYKAALPAHRKLRWIPYGNVLKSGGGYIALAPGGAYGIAAQGPLDLETTNTGLYWNHSPYTPQSYPSSSLPTCNLAYSAMIIYVTGSSTGKYMARCNGSTWIYTDGAPAPRHAATKPSTAARVGRE